MADFVLLNSGDFVLLNSGDKVILNAGAAATGVIISGTHATPFLGRRAELKIPVEFTFHLRACTIIRRMQKFRIACPLLRNESVNFKAKSALLREKNTASKFKSTIVTPVMERIAVKYSFMRPIEEIVAIGCKVRSEKLKKALLKKLWEIMEDDES